MVALVDHLGLLPVIHPLPSAIQKVGDQNDDLVDAFRSTTDKAACNQDID